MGKMIMIKYFSLLLFSIICIGCYSFSIYEDKTVEGLNQNILNNSQFHFITKNDSEYNIELQYIDSIYVKGTGQLRHTGNSNWQEFSGVVKLDSISLIEVKQRSWGKSILINSTAITLAIMHANANDGPDKPEMDVHTPSSGSCPFIYSWDGENYVLEGEAYGIAVGKALELNTVTTLPSLKPIDSLLSIKITNERPETHYTNQIKLYAIETGQNVIPVLDSENRPWPVYNPISPKKAVDHSGNNILQLIQNFDGNFWQSDLLNTDPFSDFEDTIELSFTRLQQSETASLVIRAINTKLVNSVFDQIYGYLGTSSLQFAIDLETDKELIQTLKDWIQFGSLRATVWNGDMWIDAGLIYPEANEVAFTRVIRLDLSKIPGEEVKIRLKSLTDVWKIDVIQMDTTPVQSLAWKEMELISAKGLSLENIKREIVLDDFKYAIALPGQEINLNYRAHRNNKDKKITYTLSVKGYLHEWISPSSKQQVQFGAYISNRLEYLKSILSYRSVLLPPIYADWKEREAMFKN